MNLLPWLLDWPPSPASVVVFLLVTAFSVGTLVAFGGVTDEITAENVTVEETDLSVRLNDERSLPDTNGTVQTCLSSGTPGDSISVIGDVTVDVPADRGRDAEFVVAVSLAHTEETTTASVEGTGRRTADVFWLLDDDETLAVGETARLQVRVRDGGSTVASVTREVTVENGSRSYDC